MGRIGLTPLRAALQRRARCAAEILLESIQVGIVGNPPPKGKKAAAPPGPSIHLSEFSALAAMPKGFWHLRLLRPRRPHSRAAEQRDELAASHSITSSARPSNGNGTAMPSALAAFRFKNISTFVLCWTGSSPGFFRLSKCGRRRCLPDGKCQRSYHHNPSIPRPR